MNFIHKTKYGKIIPLISASAIQICLGVAYIWSVFQTGIAVSLFGGNNTFAGLAFSILLVFLAIGGIIGGKLAERFSTRFTIIVGGIILSIGFFTAGLTPKTAPYLLWLTYGVMGGIGMGFTYGNSISCVQKWFPHKKGFVTGIIVACLGFGGVIFTPIVEALIKQFGGQGAGELGTLMVLSAIFLVVCTVGGCFMVNPTKEYVDSLNIKSTSNNLVKSLTPKEVLKNLNFYILTTIMLLACLSGLMMIGFAKPIAVGKGLGKVAIIGVLLISIFNSIGRLFWGWMSDKIGRIKSIQILLAGTLVMSLCMTFVGGFWIFVIIALIGFFYGGLLGTFPALTAEMFGPKYVATNYSMVLLGFGAGAISSSFIAGHFSNISKTNIALMNPAFFIAAACSALSSILLVVLYFRLKKEKSSTAKMPTND